MSRGRPGAGTIPIDTITLLFALHTERDMRQLTLPVKQYMAGNPAPGKGSGRHRCVNTMGRTDP